MYEKHKNGDDVEMHGIMAEVRPLAPEGEGPVVPGPLDGHRFIFRGEMSDPVGLMRYFNRWMYSLAAADRRHLETLSEGMVRLADDAGLGDALEAVFEEERSGGKQQRDIPIGHNPVDVVVDWEF